VTGSGGEHLGPLQNWVESGKWGLTVEIRPFHSFTASRWHGPEITHGARSYIVGPESSQIVRAPKGVHWQSNTEQSADRGHDNVTGHKRRPAHSLKKREHCYQFYSDSLDRLTLSGRSTQNPRGQRGFESRIDGELVILRRGLSCGDNAHAVAIEDESFYFGLGAVGGDLLTIPEESDSGGIADLGDDFMVGADGGMGRGDEGFAADGLAVCDERDPGSFVGADHELQLGGRFCRRVGIWLVGNGSIIGRGAACGIGDR
jgi:hypothetical protein